MKVLPQYRHVGIVGGEEIGGIVQHHQNDQTILAPRNDIATKDNSEVIHTLVAVNTHRYTYVCNRVIKVDSFGSVND